MKKLKCRRNMKCWPSHRSIDKPLSFQSQYIILQPMARSESNTHEPHSAPAKETLQENGNTVDANGSNNSTERRQWDFDAPRYWDLENPDAGSGFDDTWFGKKHLFFCIE